MNKTEITLRGITWNHSRGLLPLAATAQRFSELHPGVEIIWEKRSLQAFADQDIQMLSRQYDLLVIDHPWAGAAIQKGFLLPLQEHISPQYLKDQSENSVGFSHLSYEFGGVQAALAIDAAAPVAAYRPDILERTGFDHPHTWEDLLVLAKEGRVAFAGISIDLLMAFYALCSTQGQDPFLEDEWAVPEWLGVQVLEQLRELAMLVTPEIFHWNPIAVYEALAGREDLAYCPFAYGYSNYSRRGVAQNLLHFGDMVTINGRKLRTTLGGTGLAISANCTHLEAAVAYSVFTASPDCQRTLFVDHGGQPGHRSAWLDEEANRITHNYFAHTLPALDRAYLRPRYPGYLHFQDHAGDLAREYLLSGGDPKAVLVKLERLVSESKG
jgi:multiple sugar transport system substrate-binding protein